MLKKYQTHATQLSSQEMKEVKGGTLAQPGTRYDCYEGTWHIVYCGHVSPHPTCGHDYCNPGGTCMPITFNGINCQ